MLQNAEVKGRVEELQKAVTEVAVTRAGVDRAWVLSTLRQNVLRAMQRVRVLDREGKPIGVFTYNGQVANRALELIGKELGMFRNHSEQFEWDGDLTKLTDAQLDKLLQQFELARAASEQTMLPERGNDQCAKLPSMMPSGAAPRKIG